MGQSQLIFDQRCLRRAGGYAQPTEAARSRRNRATAALLLDTDEPVIFGEPIERARLPSTVYNDSKHGYEQIRHSGPAKAPVISSGSEDLGCGFGGDVGTGIFHGFELSGK